MAAPSNMENIYSNQREVLNLMRFFCFAWKKSSNYTGNVCFNFTDNTGALPFSICVHVSDEGVKVYNGVSDKDDISVSISMPTSVFLQVYSGKASVSEVTRLFLLRKIWVSSLNFAEVTRFAAIFDYSHEMWNTYDKVVGRNWEVDMGQTGTMLFSTHSICPVHPSQLQPLEASQEESLLRNLWALWTQQLRITSNRRVLHSTLLPSRGDPIVLRPARTQPLLISLDAPEPLKQVGTFCWFPQFEFFVSMLNFSAKLAHCEGEEKGMLYLTSVLSLLSDHQVKLPCVLQEGINQFFVKSSPSPTLQRAMTASQSTVGHLSRALTVGRTKGKNSFDTQKNNILSDHEEATSTDFDWWASKPRGDDIHLRLLRARPCGRFSWNLHYFRFCKYEFFRNRLPDVNMLLQRKPEELSLAPALVSRSLRETEKDLNFVKNAVRNKEVVAAKDDLSIIPSVPWAWDDLR